jgi:hypothetical protein
MEGKSIIQAHPEEFEPRNTAIFGRKWWVWLKVGMANHPPWKKYRMKPQKHCRGYPHPSTPITQ